VLPQASQILRRIGIIGDVHAEDETLEFAIAFYKPAFPISTRSSAPATS
jgi:hypothetical protein